MPFPESQRVVYKKNPLSQVIAQLQFPPVLSIAAAEPAVFQERIRASYPLYLQESAVVPPAEVANLLNRLNLTPPLSAMRHVFSTEDERRAASLARDFLALEDKKYWHWEEFRREMALLQQALEDTYHPAFYSRVGLRYVDIINRRALGLPQAEWASLINPTLLGLLGDPQLRQEVGESVSVTTLAVPEIHGGTIRLRHGLRAIDANDASRELAYTIDVDLFTQERTSANDVAGTLDVFNRVAGNLFRWAITSELSQALEPKPLAPVEATVT